MKLALGWFRTSKNDLSLRNNKYVISHHWLKSADGSVLADIFFMKPGIASYTWPPQPTRKHYKLYVAMNDSAYGSGQIFYDLQKCKRKANEDLIRSGFAFLGKKLLVML